MKLFNNVSLQPWIHVVTERTELKMFISSFRREQDFAPSVFVTFLDKSNHFGDLIRLSFLIRWHGHMGFVSLRHKNLLYVWEEEKRKRKISYLLKTANCGAKEMSPTVLNSAPLTDISDSIPNSNQAAFKSINNQISIHNFSSYGNLVFGTRTLDRNSSRPSSWTVERFGPKKAFQEQSGYEPQTASLDLRRHRRQRGRKTGLASVSKWGDIPFLSAVFSWNQPVAKVCLRKRR